MNRLETKNYRKWKNFFHYEKRTQLQIGKVSNFLTVDYLIKLFHIRETANKDSSKSFTFRAYKNISHMDILKLHKLPGKINNESKSRK